VFVRKIGYGAADTRLSFGSDETVERRIVLGRAVTLEPITVSARSSDKVPATFDENRRVGLGHFLTRDEIAKYDGMKLASVLQQIQQAGVAGGRGHEWVQSRRAPGPMCPMRRGALDTLCLKNNGYYIPTFEEQRQGMPIACWAQVYLDGALMNGAHEPTEPFEISSIAPERIEAVEFYAGPGETPLRYSRSGSNCGVLVLWTRRR